MNSLALILGHVRDRVARRYDEAIAQYQEAAELDFNNLSVHESLGTAFEQKGLLDEAVAEWLKTMKLAGDNEWPERSPVIWPIATLFALRSLAEEPCSLARADEPRRGSVFCIDRPANFPEGVPDRAAEGKLAKRMRRIHRTKPVNPVEPQVAQCFSMG